MMKRYLTHTNGTIDGFYTNSSLQVIMDSFPEGTTVVMPDTIEIPASIAEDVISDQWAYEIIAGVVTVRVTEIENRRVGMITAKADKAIESVYSPLKQRKLLSIAVALQDIVIQGGTLTTEQEALMQSTRDVNTWITAIRVAENTAILDGTLANDFNP